MSIREGGVLGGGEIPDVQGSLDLRNIPIERVGVKGVRCPIRWQGASAEWPAVALCNLYVSLPADQKGTHMSRFMALLDERSAASAPALDVAGLVTMHACMLDLLQSDRGRIEIALSLFIRKAAPVSGVMSLMDYELALIVDGSRETPQVTMTVVVPVTTLCPCSKEISKYGAHNQRSHVSIEVCADASLTPEQLIRLAEDEASCELYGVLKRVDEKHVTERAYDNPKFVEDLIRDVAARLRAEPRIRRFAVEVENFESIHNHSAYARIDSGGNG
jgi:GTP cyclohydrolase I